MVILEVTGRKQLVLTDIRHENSIVRSLFGNGIHHLTHEQRTLLRMDGGLDDLHAFLLVECLKRLAPLGMFVRIKECRECGQRLLTVGHHSHVGLHVLVDLTTVDIEVDDLCLFGIGLQVTRHTVGETHADGDEHVALLLFQVDGIIAVHAQHTDVQRMVRGECRESEHRTTSRDIGFLEESD